MDNKKDLRAVGLSLVSGSDQAGVRSPELVRCLFEFPRMKASGEI